MIIPAGYRVLIKADPIETKTEWGFELNPDQKLERAAQTNGTLVAIGQEAWKGCEAPWAKIGDRITYIRHAGKLITDPETGEDYMIINDEDVLSIIIED